MHFFCPQILRCRIQNQFSHQSSNLFKQPNNMMKPLPSHWYKCLILMACLWSSAQRVSSQMENDGIMIPKNYLCPGVMYSTSDWSNYWEGTFKRNNGNIGTVHTNMYSAMVTYGILNNLIGTVSLPYVTTHASAGTLEGQKGLQTLSLNLKWRALKVKAGP